MKGKSSHFFFKWGKDLYEEVSECVTGIGVDSALPGLLLREAVLTTDGERPGGRESWARSQAPPEV